MDNQHKQIKGYRDLSQKEIDLMNKIKSLAEEVGELVTEVIEQESDLFSESGWEAYQEKYGSLDDNFMWAESAKKDLQLGFMQLVRAVAKPQSF